MEPDASPPPPRRGRAARGTENVSGREYLGCGLWVAAFLVLVLLSFTVGMKLREEGPAGPTAITHGGSGDGAWVLVTERDDDGEPCARLFRPGDEDTEGAEITGQCGFTTGSDDDGSAPYVVTSAELADGSTVVFAPVPDGAATVRLRMADGSRPTVEVEGGDDAGTSWFLYQSDLAVDGPAQLLDPSGAPLDPP